MSERDTSGGPRTEESSLRLRCSACGGDNEATSTAKDQGWFACAFCRSVSPVHGAGEFGYRSPGDDVTVLARPGTTSFWTDGEALVRWPHWYVYLVLADVVLSLIHFGLGRWRPGLELTWVLVAIFGAGALLGWLGCRTRQSVSVDSQGVRTSRETLGVTWGRKTLEGALLRASMPVEGGRTVVIRGEGGEAAIRLRDAASAEWFLREAREAFARGREEARGGWVPCPGCGGPIAREPELAREGGAACAHCATGLVYTKDGVVLPPARLESRHGQSDPASSASPASGRDSWTLEPWYRRQPVQAWVAFSLVWLGVVGLSWGSWALALHVTHFKLVVVSLAIWVTAGCIWAGWFIVGGFAGTTRFYFADHSLHHAQTLGPFEWRHERVPLGRLLFFEVVLADQKNAIILRWKAANLEEVDVFLETTPRIGRLADGLLDEIARRLSRLGREADRT